MRLKSKMKRNAWQTVNFELGHQDVAEIVGKERNSLKVHLLTQGNVKKFDREEAKRRIESCAKTVLDVYSKPNVYEKRIAEHEGIPIEIHDVERSASVVLTTEDEYYCGGSGGHGSGGKTFWTPPDKEGGGRGSKGRRSMLGCDNCYIMGHEYHHGLGGNAEFDRFNELIAIYERLKHNDIDADVVEALSGALFSSIRVNETGSRDRFDHERRNFFLAANTRYPNQVKAVLRGQGYTDKDIDRGL